jgi:phosphoglycolate phosphatase-like HAD superfamily hydrolase
MSTTRPCYIFDIDGTVADISHRLHHIEKQPKDWDAFFAACPRDVPIPAIRHLAVTLGTYAPIVFVTGRSDRVRTETDFWLKVKAQVSFAALYMREDGDHRPDHEVKGDLLDQIMNDGWEPLMAFEDRNQVVAMWRKRGLPCCQVADGDF